jgi:predicted O-methyltransferase YrrM
MLTPDYRDYVVAHGSQLDEIARDLVAETRATYPREAGMLIEPEQAAFMTQLTKIIGVRRAVEIGTFTGFSALAIARGLADGGRLVCFDISERFTDVARRYWKRAGVEDRIELRIGPAAERLAELPDEPYLDLVFIDADKESYPTYWNTLVPRVRRNGVLLIDNTLWSGRVVDPQSDSERVIAEFNDMALADERVELVILPIADGLTMARKL